MPPPTSLERKEVHEVLGQFGLKAKERGVYLTLLGIGATTATPLATRVRLPVTTVQSLLARLAGRGLLDVTKRGTRSVYEAHDPIVLRRLLERRVEEVAAIVPLLKQLRAERSARVRVRVLERDRINDIFIASLACRSKLVHEIVAGRDLQDVIGERLHYRRRRVAAGVRLKSLRVESRENKRWSAASHGEALREVKFLPRELTFRASLTFWDNTVVIIPPHDEGFAVVIESPEVRTMCQQLFDLLWSFGRKMETA